jgi:cytochrome c oxidase cbb3-type subunit 3
MDPRSALLLSLLLSACLITACDQQGDKQGKNTTESSPAPASVATTPTTPRKAGSVPVIDPNLAFKGEELYNQNCVFCHQADAIGKPGVAPSLTNKEFLAIAPVDFLVTTITDGRPGTGMPPFAHLGEENINAIVAFLRSHATLPSRILEVDAQPHTQGDPRLGQQWFDQVCATCHGPEGNGYAAGGTGTAIGKSGFLDKVSDGFIRTTVKEGRSNTRMLPFQGPEALADLSDNEIDDIIAYLRTVPSKN